MSFSQYWFDKHTHNLNIALNDFKGKPNLKMLEIGSFEGRSATWWLDNILTHPGSHLTCVDTFQGSDEHDHMRVDYSHIKETFDENMRPYVGRYEAIVGKSQEVLREGRWPFGHFDLIYIDGSHHAYDTLEDAVLCWRFLKPKRAMMFDDYFWDHFQSYDDIPRVAIDSFIRCFRSQIKLCLVANLVILQKL